MMQRAGRLRIQLVEVLQNRMDPLRRQGIVALCPPSLRRPGLARFGFDFSRGRRTSDFLLARQSSCPAPSAYSFLKPAFRRPPWTHSPCHEASSHRSLVVGKGPNRDGSKKPSLAVGLWSLAENRRRSLVVLSAAG